MDKLVDSFLDLVFPKRCLSCRSVGSFICDNCQEKILSLESEVCPVCTRASIGGFTHHLCLKPYSPNRLVCSLKFDGPVRQGIKDLKYASVTQLSDFLVDLSLSLLSDAGLSLGGEALVLAVPSHPYRVFERGFNQSELVAASFSRRFDLEFCKEALTKVRETVSQTELSPEGRVSNVRDAFVLSSENVRRRIEGEDIVIVDDVFTTGATLRECAKVVKRGGARFVYLYTIAKD